MSKTKKILIALLVLAAILIGGYVSLLKMTDYFNERAAERQRLERERAENYQPPDESEAERLKREKEETYNACANQAYKDYQADLDFNCRVKMNGECQIEPETMDNIQRKFMDGKKECERLR